MRPPVMAEVVNEHSSDLEARLGDALAKLEDIDHDRLSVLLSMPQPVQKRVRALRKLQLEAINIEAEFYKRVHAIECEFADRLRPLATKRTQIVTGSEEPTEEDSDYPLYEVDKENESLVNALKEKLKLDSADGDKAHAGVPDFWLTVFKNVDLLAEMIQEHDEPVLRDLVDIDVQLSGEPMAFRLTFHFRPNEYFNNEVLTKDYELRCEPDKTDPFEFDGPEIVNCKGCKIDWKAGKDVTVRTIKKKQKHKEKKETRFITKQVKADSFFNFFDPPMVPDGTSPENMEEDMRDLLASDFEIGQVLRDRIVPRAVLYFTGEAESEAELEDEEEDDDFDDEDEDESMDGDDDVEAAAVKALGGR